MLNCALNDAAAIPMRRQQFDVRDNIVNDDLHLVRKVRCRTKIGVAVVSRRLGECTHDLDASLNDMIAIGIMNE